MSFKYLTEEDSKIVLKDLTELLGKDVDDKGVREYFTNYDFPDSIDAEILTSIKLLKIIETHYCSNNFRLGCSPTDDIGISIYLTDKYIPEYNIRWDMHINKLYIHKYWDFDIEDYYGYSEDFDKLKELNLIVCSLDSKLKLPDSVNSWLEFVDVATDECIKLLKQLDEYLSKSPLQREWEKLKFYPCFETKNGVIYFEPSEDGTKILYGPLSNMGVIPLGSIEYEPDQSLDYHFQGIIEKFMNEEIDKMVSSEEIVEVANRIIERIKRVFFEETLNTSFITNNNIDENLRRVEIFKNHIEKPIQEALQEIANESLLYESEVSND